MGLNDVPVAAEGMRIKVKKVRGSSARINVEELLAQVCFYYPQYTLETANKISYRRAKLLLRVAQKIEATRMYNLTQIAAAPHTKKGKGVEKLSEHFKKIANS